MDLFSCQYKFVQLHFLKLERASESDEEPDTTQVPADIDPLAGLSLCQMQEKQGREESTSTFSSLFPQTSK